MICLHSSICLDGKREDKLDFKEDWTKIKRRCSIVRPTECFMLLHNQLVFVNHIIKFAVVVFL